jgi:hypothetical protein
MTQVKGDSLEVGAETPEKKEAATSLLDPALDRRSVLAGLGAGAAALGTLLLPAREAAALEIQPRNYWEFRDPRVRDCVLYRTQMATLAATRRTLKNFSNGDEQGLPGYVGNYSKGLPHDALGHVDPKAYATLLAAIKSGKNSDFDKVILGLGRRLTSAQAGLAFDLEGCDSHQTFMPAPPRFSSAEAAAEMVELYWMALCRDVPFDEYETNPLVARACADLNAMSDFRGAKEFGQVTPAVLFRGVEEGCQVGPYISQFLWRDIPYGAQLISQRSQRGRPGVDWMTDYNSWLNVQNGVDLRGDDLIEPTRRYLRDLRGLSRWVQIDALYQGYLNACLILLAMEVPFKEGIPSVVSRSCEGFVDWGPPHLLALVTEVSTRALKAVWYHKWFVHRRLRPEAFGGRVHNHVTGAFQYPIHSDVLDSDALAEVFSRHGTYLLPMAFPEGSPTHPAYGAGHATVAGACTTILKAWFDEDHEIRPLVPSTDGTLLLPDLGPPLTVGGELNKVAANVAIGRDAAGVHWFSDYYWSIRLGEYVAKTILEEQKPSYNQSPTFRFRSFDGHEVVI